MKCVVVSSVSENRHLACWALGLFLLLGACGDRPMSETVTQIEGRSATLPPLTAGKGMDPRNTVRRGLLADPEVRERAGLISASIDQIAIERSALFPQLSLGVVGGVGNAGAGDAQLEVSGRQLLFDFGGTERAIEAADIDLQIEYQRFQSQVDTSITTVLLIYRQIAMLEEVVEVKTVQVGAMRNLHRTITERTEIGAQALPDLLEVNGRIERAEFELLDARLELTELRDRLQRLAQTSQGGVIPDFPPSCRAQAGTTDELIIARLERASAQLALEEAERAVYPGMSLNPLGLVSLGSGGVSTGMNINVETSLFEGGAIRARINQAQNRLRSAEAALETEERNMRLDDRRLDRQIASLREKQAMLARQIQLQAETRDLYRSQYIDLGSRQITDLLDAEETLYDRQIELIEVKFELQEYLVQCAERSGTLRGVLNLTQSQLYGFPLTTDGF